MVIFLQAAQGSVGSRLPGVCGVCRGAHATLSVTLTVWTLSTDFHFRLDPNSDSHNLASDRQLRVQHL